MFLSKFSKLISSVALSAAIPSLALQAQGGVAGETTKPNASNAAKKEILKDEPKSSEYLKTLVKVFGLVVVVALVTVYILPGETKQPKPENKECAGYEKVKRYIQLREEDKKKSKIKKRILMQEKEKLQKQLDNLKRWEEYESF